MRGTVCNDARYRAVTTSVIGKHRCQLPGSNDIRYRAESIPVTRRYRVSLPGGRGCLFGKRWVGKGIKETGKRRYDGQDDI